MKFLKVVQQQLGLYKVRYILFHLRPQFVTAPAR